MLDRLTVSALLRAVIGIMTLCVVTALAVSSWTSWSRLRAAARIAIVTEASANAFTAMHNLRTDKASTNKTLVGEPIIDSEMEKALRSYRDAENAAIGAVANLAATVEFVDQKTLLSDLDRLAGTLKDVQAASWDAMKKPKGLRSSNVANDYAQTSEALLQTLENLSAQLASAVRQDDPMVDQLMSVKDAAWLLREAGGQSALLLSKGLAAGHLTPDARQLYWKYVGSTETAWAALTASTSGMPLSSALTNAMADVRIAYFEPQYLMLCDRLLNSAIAGNAPEMPLGAWSPIAVKRLGTAVALAEQALGEAQSHSLRRWSAARRTLILQLLLLIAAVAVACGVLVVVNRRVIVPLHAIGEAMLKVAAGDLSADSGYDASRDEIGALAGALNTFKQHAAEKIRIEQLEQERNARTQERQRAIEAYIEEFEKHVGDALLALGDASAQMRITSDDMTAVSARTNTRVQGAVKAANDASMSVQGVASASEELSASVNDISRQAAHAAGIANRGVDQVRETDGTVLGLAKAAGRIGEVVDLISDIAGQTNLLALNATIEAARAGDAGRGFAVVASEVKSLASQTAKATEDIAGQVADIQTVVNEAVGAIKAIGGIIGQVNEVATAIAAAVEEQGAATAEITRNTQQAAVDTQDVSDNIGGVSGDADTARTAAQKVKFSSETLETQTRNLGTQITQFLGKIRAA